MACFVNLAIFEWFLYVTNDGNSSLKTRIFQDNVESTFERFGI